MRLFIGLPIPDHLTHALAHHARTLAFANASWTAAENMHLTLVFLGEVEEDRLPALRYELDELHWTPFQIQLTRLGSFSRAGVLFVEVEPTQRLLQLQVQVAAGMVRCGFALEERAYHPHITLARLRQPARSIAEHTALPASLQRSFLADAVNLYRSHAAPAGSRYEVLAQKKSGAQWGD